MPVADSNEKSRIGATANRYKTRTKERRQVSAQKVAGIDVLNSFEQELVTSIEDGNLVIENLLVEDYPIILHVIALVLSKRLDISLDRAGYNRSPDSSLHESLYCVVR